MSAVLFLRCVAKGVLKKALAELETGQGFRQRLLDIANQTYGEFQKETRTIRYLDVLAAVALTSPDESKIITSQVVAELRSEEGFKGFLEKQETVERLLGYLEQVPVSMRNRFRRPMDPSGQSIPADFRMTRPEDLMVLLPPKAPQFRVGDQPVGNWRLVQLLGIGAFGEVWKAEDAMDGDSPDVAPVALKFCLSPESIRNLRHETGLLQRIEKHLGEMKGIARLRKAWLEAEPPCLEYEYVNGGDLCGLMSEWLAQTPEKRATLALQMLHRLAKIIAPLHEMDPPIVHRDLKPANVLVSKGPNNKFDMKISDFGISGVAAGMALDGYAQSLSQSEILTSTLRGTHTPLYAGPEQRSGSPPHPTDDVHALGVIGFQLLVCDLKRSPTSDWDEELRERGIGDHPIRILRKCLARKNNRYQNASQLKEDLQTCLDGEKITETDPNLNQNLLPLPRPVEKKKQPYDPVMEVLLAGPDLSNKDSEENVQSPRVIHSPIDSSKTKPVTEKTAEFINAIKNEIKQKHGNEGKKFLNSTGPTFTLLTLVALVAFSFSIALLIDNLVGRSSISYLITENKELEKEKKLVTDELGYLQSVLINLNKKLNEKEYEIQKEMDSRIIQKESLASLYNTNLKLNKDISLLNKHLSDLEKKYDTAKNELKLTQSQLDKNTSKAFNPGFLEALNNLPNRPKLSFLGKVDMNFKAFNKESQSAIETLERKYDFLTKGFFDSDNIFNPTLAGNSLPHPTVSKVLELKKNAKPIPAVLELKELFNGAVSDDPNKSIFWVAQGKGKVPYALNSVSVCLLLDNRDFVKEVYRITLGAQVTSEIDKELLIQGWNDYSAVIEFFLTLKISKYKIGG
jgi:serine/threonine protein kinase